jgi:transcriptional regulator with XRE-family HTH domain
MFNDDKIICGEGEKEFIRSVGGRIAEVRRSRNMTQEQVGEAVGIETESVSRIETGATVPTLKRIYQFAILFKCQPVEFFPIAEELVNPQLYQLTSELAYEFLIVPKEKRESIATIVLKIIDLFTKRK